MSRSRDRIVAAAIELMRSRGFRGTGLKDVTAAAASTNGSLYHFFPGGKDELVCAAIREDGTVHEATFADIAREASGPGEAISTFFSQAADIFEATDYIDLCPIGTIAGEMASSSPQIRAACQDAFDGWQRVIATELSRSGINRGDATDLSATTIAALLGGFVLVRTRRSGAPLRAAGRQLHTLVDLHLAGQHDTAT
jgi:AcrR family transcriptional regulator